MDKIRDRLNALREGKDAAEARAEEALTKNKKLEQEILGKDQEITSLTHKLSLIEAELDNAEAKLKEAKGAQSEHDSSKTANEALSRKVQLLEDELDVAEKNLKDTVEKLRHMDLKAEHFERQVVRLTQDKDDLERKNEELHAKYADSKKELDELVMNMDGL